MAKTRSRVMQSGFLVALITTHSTQSVRTTFYRLPLRKMFYLSKFDFITYISKFWADLTYLFSLSISGKSYQKISQLA